MAEVQSGMRFGRLICLEKLPAASEGAVWRCQCDCGGTVDAREALLLAGVRTSCGCRCERALDLTGQVFGRLQVLDAVPGRAADGSVRWLCRCACGRTTAVSASKLRSGHTTSCGCWGESALGSVRTFVDGTCYEVISSQRIPRNNTSGVRGVYRSRGSWRVDVTYARRQYFLGRFSSLSEASAIRGEAERIRERYALNCMNGEGNPGAFAAQIEKLRREWPQRRDACVVAQKRRALQRREDSSGRSAAGAM